jgi:peptide/nickel transport system substrate-binding protein
MRIPKSATAIAAAGFLTLAVAACGSSSPSGSSGAVKLPLKAGENAATESITGGKPGGTLQVLSSEGFQHLDPGSAYFALDYGVIDAMQRPLFMFMRRTAGSPTVARRSRSTSSRT